MEIEKGIPLPEPYKGRPVKYPFRDMEVGDSFSIPLTGTMTGTGVDIATKRLRQAAANHARRVGGKFHVRTVREEGVARCWRTE